MYYYIFEPPQGPKAYERTAQIKELLSSLGIAGEMSAPTPGKSVEELVATAVHKRYSTIIAVGGIDLVNRTARALEPYDAVFGIIPTQEHPDITSLIGVNDWKSAAEQLKRRRFQSVRMGCMNGSTYFLTTATVDIPREQTIVLSTDRYQIMAPGGQLSISPIASEDGTNPELLVRLSVTHQTSRNFLSELFGSKRPAPVGTTQLVVNWIDVQTSLAFPVLVAGTSVATTPLRFSTEAKPIKLIVGRGVANS